MQEENYIVRDVLSAVSNNQFKKNHLIVTRDTSVYAVHLNPNEKLAMETHDENTQIFEVRAGGGSATIGSREYPTLIVGDMLFAPRGVPHEIRAGSRGMKLTTTYAPTLKK